MDITKNEKEEKSMGENVIPNREYLEFTYCKLTPTGKGLNQKVTLENLKNGCFKYTESRIGIQIGIFKPKSHLRSMDNWDSTVDQLLRTGYILAKKEKMGKKVLKKDDMSVDGSSYAVIKDENVRMIVNRIMGFANKVVRSQYIVKVDDISDEMISLGAEILKGLSNKVNYGAVSIGNFNAELVRLFSVIPRRMDNVSNYLAKDEDEIPDILKAEQELYDVLISQLRTYTKENSSKEDILTANGLKIQHVSANEAKMLRERLGSEGHRYIDAWKVRNLKSKQAFDEFCRRENLTDGHGIDHLFHGSRNENWWSILTKGLTVNPPAGVVICGKAYGYGIYFAPQACKSMGYTSRAGSKWAGGSSESGFLLLNEVATGKRYDGHLGIDTSLNWEKLKKIAPGCLCTWAESRYSGFVMDEVIVYRDCQSTPEYLIEVGL